MVRSVRRPSAGRGLGLSDVIAHPRARLALGIVGIGVGYWALAQLGAVVQYTGEVEVAWLPVGWAAAVLYLGDLRWFIGATIADLILGTGVVPFHADVLTNPTTLQTLSNTVEFTVAAILMRRWLGPRSALERPVDVAWLFAAIAIGTAIAAAFGALTIVWAAQAPWNQYPELARTWWLGDTSGGMLIAPLLVTWGSGPWRWDRLGAARGVVAIGAVAALSFVVFDTSHPLTYLVFPALTLAAVSLGQRGATVGVVVAFAVAAGMTASNIGPFIEHSITDAALQTQLYILVATLTTLTLGAAVSARRHAAVELAESRRREAERAAEERERIASDLHDSVSQTLFTLGLHAGIARHEAGRAVLPSASALPGAIEEVAELAQSALAEMRASIFELRGDVIAERGLVAALQTQATALAVRHDVEVTVEGPSERLALAPEAEELLFRIGQEAITNAVKHSGSPTVAALIAVQDGHVTLDISDHGVGFDPARAYVGHLGLDLMRRRAAAAGGSVVIESGPETGTAVHVRAPTAAGAPAAITVTPPAPRAPRAAPPASVS